MMADGMAKGGTATALQNGDGWNSEYVGPFGIMLEMWNLAAAVAAMPGELQTPFLSADQLEAFLERLQNAMDDWASRILTAWQNRRARNCDKFDNGKDAEEAWALFCGRFKGCAGCPFSESDRCFSDWSFAEVGT